MFDKFKQLSELKKMRDQAMQIQKQLDQELIKVSRNGVEVEITAAQKLTSITSNDRGDQATLEAVNEAIKESQKVAAKKMQSMVGLEGLKGMLGQ